MLISGTSAVQAQNGGWHFGSWSEGPISAFTQQPNDACQRNEMKSPGMLSYLNAKVGQNYGPSIPGDRLVAMPPKDSKPLLATGCIIEAEQTIRYRRNRAFDAWKEAMWAKSLKLPTQVVQLQERVLTASIFYSITSSARASMVGSTSRPIALA